jgi:hypothetical protein
MEERKWPNIYPGNHELEIPTYSTATVPYEGVRNETTNYSVPTTTQDETGQ